MDPLEAALRAAGAGTWRLDIANNVVTWDPALRAQYGVAPDAELSLETFLGFVHPDDRARVSAAGWHAIETRTTYREEFRIVRADGTVRWIMDTGTVTYGADGAPQYMLGAGVDVTDRVIAATRVRHLQALGDTLSHAFTKDAVSTVIVDGAREIAGADGAYVVIVEPDGAYASVTASRGLDAVPLSWRRFALDGPFPAARAMSMREPVWVEKRDELGANYPDRPTLPFVGAAVLPLAIDEHTIGAIGFRYRDERHFTAEEREFLVAVAGQCAQAMLRASLFDAERQARAAAERGRRHTEQLQELTSALAAASDETEIAAVVLGEGLKAFGTHAGSVVRVLDEEDSIEIIAHAGYPDAVASRFRRHPLVTPSPATDAIRAREPFRIDNVEALHARYPYLINVFDAMGVRGCVSLPLLVGDVPIGGIALYLTEPERFADDDWRMLRTFAGQCAQAMARARHLELEQRSRHEQGFLAAASAALAESLDSRATLQRLADLVTSSLADWCVVFMAEGAGEGIRRAATSAPEHTALVIAQLEAAHPMKRADGGAIARVVNEGTEVIAPDVRDEHLQAWALDDAHLALLRAMRYRSVVVLPLRARGTVIGAVLLGTGATPDGNPGRRLGTRDVALARRLSERAALAIDNARLYEAARQANRVKSEFLAVMSHELRTPLNAIGGYVELLELELRGPVTPAQRRDLERIRISQQHLLGLISSVLDLSRIESGRVAYELEAIPVDAFLQSLDALIAPQVAASALTLAYEACPASLGVRADREKLRQVVLNLLSNAVRYTPAGGTITLSASVNGPMARIIVADTGIGIAPDALERVFEPFVQLDRSLTRGRDGVGLGLAISRDLARGMGGDLSATSTPGEGSAFTLTLPRVRLEGPTTWAATSEMQVVPGGG